MLSLFKSRGLITRVPPTMYYHMMLQGGNPIAITWYIVFRQKHTVQTNWDPPKIYISCIVATSQLVYFGSVIMLFPGSNNVVSDATNFIWFHNIVVKKYCRVLQVKAK